MEQYKYFVEKRVRKETARGYYYKVKRIMELAGYEYSYSAIARAIRKLRYANKQINNILAGIKHFQDYLKSEGYKVPDVYSKLKETFKWRGWEVNPIEYFNIPSEDEIRLFFRYLEGDTRIYFALLTVGGMRPGELMQLDKRWIDLDRRVIIWPKEMQRRNKKVFVSFFTKEVRDMLEDYLAKLEDYRLFKSRVRIWRTFKKVSRIVGKRIQPKHLRKFWATYSIMNGMNPIIANFIQGRFGWDVLQRYYYRQNILSLRREYDKVWGEFRLK